MTPPLDGPAIEYFRRFWAKMTQEKLAEAIGVKRNTIAQWEGGFQSPSRQRQMDLCRLFDAAINNCRPKFAIAIFFLLGSVLTGFAGEIVSKTKRMTEIEAKYGVQLLAVDKEGDKTLWIFGQPDKNRLFGIVPIMVKEGAINKEVEAAIMAADACAVFYEHLLKDAPKPTDPTIPFSFVMPHHPGIACMFPTHPPKA